MIENWKQLYRMHSVQLAAIVACVAGLEAYLPSFEAAVPPWAYAIASIAVIVARVISQPKLRAPDQLRLEVERANDAARKGGLMLIVLLAVACSEPRHPGRADCDMDADRAAAEAYLTECAGYENTRVCPHGDDIEARHDAALEACR